MLNKLSINQRLYALMGVMVTAILFISALSLTGLNYSSSSLEALHSAVKNTEEVSKITSTLQDDLIGELNNLRSGVTTWVQSNDNIAAYEQTFQSDLQQLIGSAQSAGMAVEQLQIKGDQVNLAIGEFLSLGQNQSRAELELFLLNDLEPLVNPFIVEAHQLSANLSSSANNRFESTENSLFSLMIAAGLVILAALAGTLTLSLLISRSIQTPLEIISHTVAAVKNKQADVRSNLKGDDELTVLANALDSMLDEKEMTLAQLERENDAINNSIIELLEGASDLSDRDLNVELTVREDITGPVADSINLVTKEIRDALVKVREVSQQVQQSSTSVKQQTVKISSIAGRERKLVVQSFNKLNELSKAMMQIANWCTAGNDMANTATQASDQAVGTVNDTMESMDNIRNTISQAEKRIKRLSERSQEITSIVDIINNISERTHVLALNASMQAATAGEAGKGFAVVADEVQRLAESSHNSTSQIGVLIRNIQTETAEAVDVMNQSIALVVDGSQKAEQAGEQMSGFKLSMSELTQSVKQISDSAQNQLSEAKEMQQHSMAIEKSTRISEQELQHQTQHNQKLAQASDVLLSTVNLFKLPQAIVQPDSNVADITSAIAVNE